jgi:hypothetical protein
MNQVIIVYHVTAAGQPEMGPELADMKLMSPGEVEPWSQGTGPALEDWLNERGYL